jgi:hypothetical protein
MASLDGFTTLSTCTTSITPRLPSLCRGDTTVVPSHVTACRRRACECRKTGELQHDEVCHAPSCYSTRTLRARSLRRRMSTETNISSLAVALQATALGRSPIPTNGCDFSVATAGCPRVWQRAPQPSRSRSYLPRGCLRPGGCRSALVSPDGHVHVVPAGRPAAGGGSLGRLVLRVIQSSQPGNGIGRSLPCLVMSASLDVLSDHHGRAGGAPSRSGASLSPCTPCRPAVAARGWPSTPLPHQCTLARGGTVGS